MWIVLLLIFVDSPAFLFRGTLRDDIGRTPMYPILVGGISFNEVMAVLLMVKSFTRKRYPIIYLKQMPILVVLLIYGFVIAMPFGLDSDAVVQYSRRILMWFFLLALPRLMAESEEWEDFFRLLFPLIFIMLIDQLYIFITNKPLAVYLNPALRIPRTIIDLSQDFGEASRIVSGIGTNLVTFTGALILIARRAMKPVFSSSFLYLILFAAFFQVLLSATRGWFIAYFVMLLLHFSIVASTKRTFKLLPATIILFFFVVGLFSYSPLLKTQFTNAWARISTLQDLASGDVTAQGTLRRLTDHAPALLSSIRDSPFGYGFSTLAIKLENEHVGPLSAMITIGVWGHLLVLVLVFGLILKLLALYQQASSSNYNRKLFLVAILPVIGLLIIHFSSRQIFGLNVGMEVNLLVPILISIVNWIVVETIEQTPVKGIV